MPINPELPVLLRPLARVKYLRTLATQLVYLPSLVRELRRADVVHVFSASYWSFVLAPLPAVIVARLLGRPVLINYRSGEAPDHLRRSAIARSTLRAVDRNIVPSRFLQQVFAEHGIPAQIIPNVIDREKFRFRLRDPLQPRLLSTRNFEPLYDVASTLRAFGVIQRRYPTATLTLVGAGSEDASLRRLAAELGLRGVTFAGRVAPEAIPQYYAAADIYVQTPTIDNMPSSILEAFASGLPVVSTEAGGVPAMLTDEVHGLLAPVGDAGQIAAQVVRLLEDSALAQRLALAARDSTEALVWERVRDRWVAVYRDAGHPIRSRAADQADMSSAHLWRRLAAMDRHELWFRASAAGRRQAGHVAYVTRPPQWHRDRMTRALAADPSTRPAIACLQRGDWMGAHEALMHHFATRRPRFVLHPAARSQRVRTVLEQHPGARADATRRGDQVAAGRFDLLGYKGLSFGNAGERERIDWHLDPVHRTARATSLLEPSPLSRALLRRPQGRLGAEPSPVVADPRTGVLADG